MGFVTVLNSGQYESPPFIDPNDSTKIGTDKLGTEGLGFSAEVSKSFMSKEKEHKTQWLTYASDRNVAKFKLMTDQQNEWFDYGINNVDENAEVGSKTEAEKTIYDQFVKASGIVAKHTEEWKDLCTDWHKKGMDIYTQQKTIHDSFKKYIK